MIAGMCSKGKCCAWRLPYTYPRLTTHLTSILNTTAEFLALPHAKPRDRQAVAAGAQGRREEGADADFEEEFEEEERALKASGGARAWGIDDGPFKLVLIVNMELKMGKGKASTQTALHG